MKTNQFTHAEQIQILAKCALFKGVADDEIAGLCAKMDHVAIQKGRLIMAQGDLSSDIFFLISGSAIGQLVADSGRQIVFTEIAAGGYFGELSGLDGGARSITISATSDCVLFRLSRPKFQELLMSHPQIGINLATQLAARLRAMNDRVFSLVVHDVETRVCLRLMQLAQQQEQLVQDGEIMDVPTHEGMANFIGSNREAVSRAIARLSKADIIKTGRKKYVVRDLAGLLAIGHGSPD